MPVNVSGKSRTLSAIQSEKVSYKTGEDFMLTGKITSFRRIQVENIVCCSVYPVGIAIFSRFLHPSKIPPSFPFISVKKVNAEKSLIFMLPLKIVPMGLKRCSNTVLIPSGLCLQIRISSH